MQGKRVLIKDIMHYLFPPEGKPASIAPSLDAQKPTPYPYPTRPEPGNPTVIPAHLLSRFHFVFLIRDPHHSVPSYYRCTIPPLDQVTGFHNYDPREAGYDELRRGFDFLCKAHLVDPRVANNASSSDSTNGQQDSGIDICVVDADDMLDAPIEVIQKFCGSVGLPYTEDMLHWDNPEDQTHARHVFEKWRGFHNDAIDSTGLVGRKERHHMKPEAQYDAEWRSKYGDEAAALIRKAVDANMDDYLYLKNFAMRV